MKENSQVLIPHLLMEVVRKLMIQCDVICFFSFLNHQKGKSIQEIVDRNTNQPQLIMLVEEDLQTQFLLL